MTTTLRLLEALIACCSVTPADGGCEALLRAPLEAAGFSCESPRGGGGDRWQVSNLHAGTGVTNVIPGELVVDFNFRFSTESTPEGLQERVHEVLQRHGVQHDITWTLGGVPFLTQPGTLCNALVVAVEAEFGRTPTLSTTGGTSDGRFFATACPQVMEFGVRNDSAHKVNEWVELAAIEPLKNTYRRTLRAFLP